MMFHNTERSNSLRKVKEELSIQPLGISRTSVLKEGWSPKEIVDFK